MNGRIVVTVEEAPPHPYSPKGEPPWVFPPARLADNAPVITGGERIAEAFRLALSRSARRRRERERAMELRRPRYRPLPERCGACNLRPRAPIGAPDGLCDPCRDAPDGLIPPPPGWHLTGECPECRP